MSPIEAPAGVVEMDVNPEEVGDMIALAVNGIDVPVTLDTIKNEVVIQSGSMSATYDTLFVSGLPEPLTVAVGDELSILVNASIFPSAVMDLMKDGEEVEIHLKVDTTEVKAKAVVNDKR